MVNLTFFFSCLLAKNVSLRYFCGSCVVVCGGALSVLFSTWEKSLSVQLYSTSATAPATDAFLPTQALTLCLKASGWRDFAHGRSLHSSHCRSYLSLFLWLWLHLLLRLSCFLSSITLQLFFPSPWRTTKPISFSDTSTGCPAWTMTLESGFPKTLTRFKAANKLAANYLSNTCWRRR